MFVINVDAICEHTCVMAIMLYSLQDEIVMLMFPGSPVVFKQQDKGLSENVDYPPKKNNELGVSPFSERPTLL